MFSPFEYFFFSEDEEKLKGTMRFRFDSDELGVSKKSSICVEYILIKRSKVLRENGISKEYAYLALVGYKEYLKSKSLKMVYSENREIAVNTIARSLCEKGSSLAVFSENPMIIDSDRKLSKMNVKISLFLNFENVC